MYGNYGKLLDIDLNTWKINDYPVPEEYYERFVGGKGLGARLLWDLLPSEETVDPLGPDNPMLMLSGPLTGIGVTATSRVVLMSKSPLSKFVLEAYGGGYFPEALKKSGYDGIIIRGKSKKPVILEIIDDRIELVDASQFWGKGVFNAHDYYVEKFGKTTRTAFIGQAGENLVRYAAVILDKNRAAARGGPGAVLGSKMFKGVVIKGNKKPDINDAEKLKEARSAFRKRLMEDMNMRDGFGKYGTSGGVSFLSKGNILPTKNFKYGNFEHNEKINGAYMEESGLLVDRETCATCPVACKRVIESQLEVGEEKHELLRDGSSLEYETLAAFGSLLLNGDIKVCGLANQLCNDYGLDTISTGVSIAFAMEATERGLNEPLGLELHWEKSEDIITAINKISFREEWGDKLAEGTMRMAEMIGNDEFALHTKGMEIAMHEARGKVGLGLSYAVSPRGGTHMEGLHDSMIARDNANPDFGAVEAIPTTEHKGKGAIVANFENARSFTNSMIFCAFDVASTGKNNNLGQINEMYEAATGYPMDMKTMLETGNRIYNMWRLVAVREGLTAEDDILPKRFMYEELDYGDQGKSAIGSEKLKIMLEEYYAARKWDSNGKPNEEALKDLSI